MEQAASEAIRKVPFLWLGTNRDLTACGQDRKELARAAEPHQKTPLDPASTEWLGS